MDSAKLHGETRHRCMWAHISGDAKRLSFCL